MTDDARFTDHPMYSPSDLRYFRDKGYGDDEILAFWDRDHEAGKKPVHHQAEFIFKGFEFPTAAEALQHINADPNCDSVILFAGKYYAVTRHMARRLECFKLSFAHVYDREMPDGTSRIVTIPVNQDQ